jgi:enoyl-CoA hydratase/carnithine racemase
VQPLFNFQEDEMPDFKDIIYEVKEHIAIITLHRPDSLNAWYKGMNDELKEAALLIENDPEVRVAIITGSGEKSFCSGIDLKKIRSGESFIHGPDIRDYYDGIHKLREVFTMYEGLAVPVIAAVNGYCLGGGLELALACDIRLASEDAVFSLPEVQLGIIPDLGGCQRLPRAVGIGKAKELIYTGRRIDAQEALRIGLIQQVFTKNELMNEALRIAGEIAAYNPVVVQSAKRACNVAMSYPLEIGLNFETTTSAFAIRDSEKGKGPFTL